MGSRGLSAVILQNEKGEGPEGLSPILTEAGFELRLRFREVHPVDADADLVVVLGGPMGVYEDKTFPFLAVERELLKRRLAAGRPNMGICLGAQLLASAGGAEVYPGTKGFELGVLPVQLTQAGLSDSVFSGLPSALPVAHWHGDTFRLPPKAELLASTTLYEQQAFRLGASYGFQFHPELKAARLREWLVRAPSDVARTGKPLDQLLTDLPLLEQVEAHWTNVLRRLAKKYAQIPVLNPKYA